MTRSALFAGSWKADRLHILTHGKFNSAEALLSSLAAIGASDAILAAELPALPLRGLQLAVLSACQGGRIGERISGELYGFPWALLGGAASTVLSRWDINGASNGQWMAVFYKELAKGTSTAMAAAVAMREMRKQGGHASLLLGGHASEWAVIGMSSVGGGIVGTTKNVGIVLSGLSGVAYACGYLVLRARSRALGTDPGFAFIDQAYVFAGFRFVLALLVSLLVTVPALLALDAVGRLSASSGQGGSIPWRCWPPSCSAAQPFWAHYQTLGVSGLLLTPSSNWIGDAALGRNNSGTVIQLMTTGAAVATALWLNARFRRRNHLDGSERCLH